MNISRQLATTAAEDAVSMYLSFDESMSNVSYKSTATSTTLDTSEHSGKDDSNGNTTLEPQKDDDFVETMKDPFESSELSAAFGPLRPLALHALREFKALSSTPSKNDDNRVEHIGVTENATCPSAKRKSNLSGVFENLITKFEKSSCNEKEQEDKENQPIISEDSMPSFSKTSILELQKANEKLASNKKNKEKPEKSENMVDNSIEKTKRNIPEVKKKVKMHTVVRKSLCEPNLQTNRPSRIVPNKPRYSYMNNGEAVNVGGTMWPIYRSNKYHVADERQQLAIVNESATPSEDTVEIVGDKLLIKPFRKSLKPSTKAANVRKSVLPSVSSEIRYAPQRRMSTLVKTTLNSSTRKSTYKSNAGTSNTAISQRRSVLLLKNKLASPLLTRKKASYRSSHSSSDNYISTVRAAGGGDVGKQTTKVSSARRTIQIEKPEVKFNCTECGALFNVKSLFDAHKRSHQVVSPDTVKLRSQNTGGSTSVNHGIAASNSTNHKCKYCDKGFAIERALHIHLLEHCPKIPAADRRKLNFNEMDHVTKAETPHFRLGSTRPQKKNASSTMDGSKDPLLNFPVKKYQEKVENNLEMLSQKKKDDNVKNEEKITPPNAQIAKAQMGPPASMKIKKNNAHTGVYRTPNKDIHCLACKQSFKNIIDYTNHMMNVHKSLNSSNNNVSTDNDKTL